MGALLPCKAEQGWRPVYLRGKALGGRHDGIMNSSKFGVMKCFVEDVEALWNERAPAFPCHVIDACLL